MSSPTRLAGLFLAAAALTLPWTIGAQSPSPEASASPAASASAGAAPGSFKVGIMTGTVSQGEDEFRGAQMVEKDQPGLIKHVTYPDNFMQESETTISQVTGLASDQSVKAIVIAQAIPGSISALKKVKATRPDILFFLVEPHEDTDVVNKLADFAILTDQQARGSTIVELAHKMGAKKFVHYSFPRHLSQEPLAKRRDKMKEVAEKLGMEFINATAPDPMKESGVSGAQQFIKEDVPRQVSKYGKKVAFFSTNCAMQEPLIKATMETGAIFPEQCCPSPTHGYPGALGLAIPPEKSGDVQFISDQIKAKVAEAGRTGKFATWKVAANIVAIKAAVEMARLAVEGKLKLDDAAAVEKELERAAAGADIKVSKWNPKEGNFYLMLSDSVIY
jgi:hypothetical protein